MAMTGFKENQKELAIKIVVMLLSMAVLYGVVIHPALREMTLLRASVQNTQARLALIDEVRVLQGELEGFEKPLAVSGDNSLILGDLSRLATKNQLDIQSMVPKIQSFDDYNSLRVDMGGEGSFFSLMKFLKDLDATQIFVVRDFSISLQKGDLQKEKTRLLQIHIIVETYLKQKPGK